MTARAAPRPHPWVTLALIAVTVVVALEPAVQRALVLDRDAVAAGQLWRVATGSLVHFSTSHLLFDLLAVIITGVPLERRGWALGPIVAASATAIGAGVLFFAPELARYGGLSGVGFTLVVLYVLDCLTARGPLRWAAAITLVLTAIKLGWELWSGAFVFVGEPAAFQPVPVAHVIGAGVGFAAYFLSRARRLPHGAPTLLIKGRSPA